MVATENAAGILVTWTATTDAELGGHYRIYRSVDAGPISLYAETADTFYEDSAVSPGHVYQYAISSVSVDGIESGTTSVSIARTTLGAMTSGGACVVVSSDGGVSVYADNCIDPQFR
ncbi:MAG: hypothetical protein ACYDCK_00100 [Thermoplasmatota archaeon]